MTLSRENQAQFAKELLPIVETTDDAVLLGRLHKIAAIILEWSGFEDNGIAFDLSEYTYEKKSIAEGKKSTGWDKESKTSLLKQLDDQNQ
jgi:hypothetical protein